MNFGRAAGFDSGGDARGGINPADMRQWQSNMQQMLRDARDLRRNLQQSGGDAADLRQMDEALRAMDEAVKAGTPIGLQDLTARALQEMSKLEFRLRKRLDTSSDQLFLAGAEEAPAEFRPMVEDYNRRLSRPAAATPAPPPGR